MKDFASNFINVSQQRTNFMDNTYRKNLETNDRKGKDETVWPKTWRPKLEN